MLDIDEAVAGQAAGITIASRQGGETPGSVNDDRLASAIEPASAAAVQVSPTGVEHLVGRELGSRGSRQERRRRFLAPSNL